MARPSQQLLPVQAYSFSRQMSRGVDGTGSGDPGSAGSRRYRVGVPGSAGSVPSESVGVGTGPGNPGGESGVHALGAIRRLAGPSARMRIVSDLQFDTRIRLQ